MRCKNCGYEKDDNLYICQNCGSPLYDEEEENTPELEKTQIFAAQGRSNSPAPKNGDVKKDDEDKKKKQNTIIIIVLCVVLIAVIAGTVIAIASAKKKNDDVSSLTQVSTSEVTTTKKQAISTTETTTETTTTTTTTTTTEAAMFKVTLSCSDGGEVEGEGTYELGAAVTVSARADDGYEFDGWYIGKKKVSSNTDYTFTITKDTNLKAVFAIVNDSEGGLEIIGNDQD